MSDAPESLYVWSLDNGFIFHRSLQDEDPPAGVRQYQYRRADLPATDAQALANPKVKALVELLREYREKTPLGHQPHMIAHRVDAALAAIKETE